MSNQAPHKSLLNRTMVTFGGREPMVYLSFLEFIRRSSLRTGILLITAVLLPNIFLFGGGMYAEGNAVEATASAVVFRYTGVLTRPDSADGSIVRRFEVVRVDSGDSFFFVMDDIRSGCQWPESFGYTKAVDDASGVIPHLLYEFSDVLNSVNLPPLLLSLPETVEPETSWEQNGMRLRVLKRAKSGDDNLWVIEARERRGRQQTLTVRADSGVLISAEADVFLGRGDQFQLKMNLSDEERLPESATARLTELQSELIALQAQLNRRPDTHHSELSARQAELISMQLPRLAEAARDTPLVDLVMRVTQDVDIQKKRIAATSSRGDVLMNSMVPEFSLNLISGGVIDSQSLRGKIVVLHFWDYRDQPLAEPYGQTGYLDFVANQRRKLNVQVIGVCSGQSFYTPDTLAAGRRGARKMIEFMNLTYPVAYDDGSLLRAVGDPRETNGKLPLWIVLSAEGRILHYHAGYYEIDPAKGLQELDGVLTSLIKDADSRSKAEAVK